MASQLFNGTADGVHNAHLLGLSQKAVSKKVVPSIPAKMYYLPEVYELERRAIFSKHWFLISHESRYRNTGDFVQHEMAGFSFVVVRNKEGGVIGFHNICRHRAFPVVQEDSGRARIFSCKYHGWSYDLNGKLAKAPRFTPNSVDEFDTVDKSLFRIHTHVDRNGFVYANLDAREPPQISWDAQYGTLDLQDVLVATGIRWEDVEYDFTWRKEGHFNWKLMQDNYNECYHCATAHPDVARTTRLDTYYVVPGSDGTYISHFSEPKATNISAFDATRFAGRSATHVFPVGHFSPNPGTGFMHLMRTIPTGPTTCRQEYDVYKLNTKYATPEAREQMLQFYQKVTGEDIDLCNAAQRNLNRGVYVSGPLHPFYEEGVLAFQGMVKKILTDHMQEEDRAGKQIWPAERQQDSHGDADKLCDKHDSCDLRSDLRW